MILRDALAVALVATLASLAARHLLGVGPSWSWAVFGAIFLGGQNLAIVGRAGGFTVRPRQSLLFFLAMLGLGALLGYVAGTFV